MTPWTSSLAPTHTHSTDNVILGQGLVNQCPLQDLAMRVGARGLGRDSKSNSEVGVAATRDGTSPVDLSLQQGAGSGAHSGRLARARGWESRAAVPPLCRLLHGRSGSAAPNARPQCSRKACRGWQVQQCRNVGRTGGGASCGEGGRVGKPYPCLATRRGPAANAEGHIPILCQGFQQ